MADGAAPTSVFRDQRLDYDRILELIAPGASVLDVGCGGGLLSRARAVTHDSSASRTDEDALLAAVRRGLGVVQYDSSTACRHSATASSTSSYCRRRCSRSDTERIVDETVRVGHR